MALVNERRLNGIEGYSETGVSLRDVQDMIETVRKLRQALEQAIELAYCASDEDDDGRPWPRMEKLEMLLKEVS